MNVSCSAIPCPILLNSKCVIYEGASLVYTGIITNDTLQTALEKIDEAIGNAGGGGGGTVTSFSSGNLSPLFTTSVATSTTTPSQTFSLSNAPANTVFGNNTAGVTSPGFQTDIDISGEVKANFFRFDDGLAFAGNSNGTTNIYSSPAGFAVVDDQGALNLFTVANTTGDSVISGNLTINNIPALGVAGTVFLTHVGGLVESRTAAQVLSDIGAQGSGSYISALTGDVTATGPGSVVATLATVNSNVGSFGSSTSIPSFTVNGKGLITAASGNVVIAPAGTLSGTILASNVITSSLTTVSTITSGVWNAGSITSSGGISGTTGTFSSIGALGSASTVFLTHTGGLLQTRTAAQVLSDIGGASVGGTMYIGTTAHALNRASAAEGLAGITGLTPGANFTLTQNSVSVVTSEETGAVAATLYLKAGQVGIRTQPSSQLHILGVTGSQFTDGIRVTRDGTPTEYLTLNYSGGSAHLTAVETLGTEQEVLIDYSTDGSSATNMVSFKPTVATFSTPIAMGTNSITMTGSLGATGARVTKGWFTDLEVTNAIAGSVTGNAATVTTNANLTGAVTSVGNATSSTITNAALTGASTSFTNLTGSVQMTINIPTATTNAKGITLRNPNTTIGAGNGIGFQNGTGATDKSFFSSRLTASGTDTRFAWELTASGTMAEVMSLSNVGELAPTGGISTTTGTFTGAVGMASGTALTDFAAFGTNAQVGAGKVNITASAATYNLLTLKETAGTSDAGFLKFYKETGAEIGSITRVTTTDAVAFNTTSDRRLKMNIVRSKTSALSLINKIEIDQFDWKTGNRFEPFGFIAQDLYKVVPNAVTIPKDSKNSWMVDKSSMVPMLIKALQEALVRIEYLEEKFNIQ